MKTQYEQQKGAINRYLGKLTSIHLHLKPEDKQRIIDAAKAAGMSVTEYILKKTEDPPP